MDFVSDKSFREFCSGKRMEIYEAYLTGRNKTDESRDQNSLKTVTGVQRITRFPPRAAAMRSRAQ